MQQSIIFIPKTRQEWSLALLILFYLAAGLNHFRMPSFYLPLIPDYLPFKSLINIASGIAEMLLALLLLFEQTRKWAAIGIILLLLCFLPSHIWFIQQGGCVDPGGLCVPEWIAWVRLLLIHPILIWWAWHFTRS
jgi:uncharacterized membrane protein